MQKNVFILFFSWLLFQHSFVFGQASNVLKHQRLDFEQFQKAFVAVEAKADLHLSADSLTKEFQRLREQLRSPLSPLEQFRIYSLFLNKLQSGHTQISPSKQAINEWYKLKQCLPFDLMMVNKRLFVSPLHPADLKKDSPENTYKRTLQKTFYGGVEIVSIDRKSIAEWMQIIAPYISSDEDNLDFKYVIAGHYFDFYRFVALAKFQRVVEIQYIQKRDTLTTKVELGGPNNYSVKHRLEPAKNMGYSFEILNSKIGYFNFSSFKDANSEAYSEFLKTSFEELRKKKIDRLIVDVRGNSGGQIQYELMAYFLKHPKELGEYHFEKILSKKELRKMGFNIRNHASKVYLKTDKNAANRKAEKKVSPANSSLQFKGDLIVLTDEGTFSAAAILAAHLKTLCEAKLLGETAGGTFYAGNSGTLSLTLRKSKLSMTLNPNFFSSHLYDEKKHERDSLVKIPDVHIFSEALIPAEKYQEIPQKKKSLDDPVVKQAIKTFREFD